MRKNPTEFHRYMKDTSYDYNDTCIQFSKVLVNMVDGS